MNIILFCLPLYGKAVIQKLIEQGMPPSFIVGPAKSYPLFDKMLETAHEYNLPVIMFDQKPDEEAFVKRINELSPDLIISASYPHLLPDSILSAAKIAAVNAHPSLLPEYRGASPCFHVIANGEQETGVTLHLLDNHFDTGNIITQKKYAIKARETQASLEQNMSRITADMIVDFIKTVEATGMPKTIKQTEGTYIKAPAVKLPLPVLNWNQSSAQIDRLIRAANLYYAVMTYLNNKPIFIFSGRPVKSTSKNLKVGQIESIDELGMRVSTKDGAYLITSLEYPDFWHGDPLGLFELELININDCFS